MVKSRVKKAVRISSSSKRAAELRAQVAEPDRLREQSVRAIYYDEVQDFESPPPPEES